VRACSGVQSCYVRHCSEVQEVCGNFDGTFSPRKNACIKMRTSRDQSPADFSCGAFVSSIGYTKNIDLSPPRDRHVVTAWRKTTPRVG